MLLLQPSASAALSTNPRIPRMCVPLPEAPARVARASYSKREGPRGEAAGPFSQPDASYFSRQDATQTLLKQSPSWQVSPIWQAAPAASSVTHVPVVPPLATLQ